MSCDNALYIEPLTTSPILPNSKTLHYYQDHKHEGDLEICGYHLMGLSVEFFGISEDEHILMIMWHRVSETEATKHSVMLLVLGRSSITTVNLKQTRTCSTSLHQPLSIKYTISKTLALDGGEWSASCPSHFNPRKELAVPTVKEAVWALEPVWMWWKKEKIPFLPPTRN
jgi:hypothetical protein